ncbi:MAG: AAA family ATPase [bacterium]
MKIHIEKIHIRSDGPLAKDFDLDCGALNLIYGHNESGKSYIVECLITSLFKDTKWNGQDLRWGDDIRAEVTVSGLGGEPVQFTQEGKDQLQAHWADSDNPLPGDLAHLLVVKEGSTWLGGNDTNGQGVDIKVLRNFLSEQKLFDDVQNRIKPTEKKAKIEGGVIQGDDRGLIATHRKKETELRDKTNFLEKFNNEYSMGNLEILKNELSELEESREKMQKAKDHKAWKYAEKERNLTNQLHEIASEGEIAKLKADINNWREGQQNTDSLKEKLPQLEKEIKDHLHLIEAEKNYQKFIIGSHRYNHSRWLLWLSFFLLLAAIITGRLGFNIIAVCLSISTVAILGWHIFSSRKSGASNQVDNDEMENLKRTYQKKFGETFRDLSSLQAKTNEFKGLSAIADIKIKEYNDAVKESDTDDKEISSKLTDLTGQTVSRDTWDETIQKLKEDRQGIDIKREEVRRLKEDLGIAKDNYLREDPGQDWDQQEFERIENERVDVLDKIENEKDKADRLKSNLSVHSGIQDETNLNTLLKKVVETREEMLKDCLSGKAEIMGQILVSNEIDKMRQNKNERIRDALKDSSLTKFLQKFSRYDDFNLTAEEQLEVRHSSGKTFPIFKLSSGAKEQVFLSLRVGFASKALNERSGFLLLDDAFQHSDWEQRKHMVDQCLKLVESGWQVFYFTMDENLRDLFLEKGESLGERFKTEELARRQAG